MNRRERELLFEKLVRRARREGGLPRPDEAWRMSTLQAVARNLRYDLVTHRVRCAWVRKPNKSMGNGL